MAKLTLPPFVGQPGAGQLNTWKEQIEAAVEDQLSRSGELPNHMEADLDMDSNDILNVNRIAVQDITFKDQPIEGILTAATAEADRAEAEADRAEAGASAAELFANIANVFSSRQEFLDATVSPTVTRAGFLVDGNAYFVVRDSSGPIEQANGDQWKPDGVATPQHFGAVGDGIADDTISLQDFFDYPYPKKADTINHVYRVASPLTITDTALDMKGGTVFADSSFTGDRVITVSGGHVELFNLNVDCNNIVGLHSIRDSSLDELVTNRVMVSNCIQNRGIWLSSTDRWISDGLTVKDCSGINLVRFDNAKYGNITNSSWVGVCVGRPISLEDSEDVNIFGIFVEDKRSVTTGDRETVYVNNCKNVHFSGIVAPKIEGNLVKFSRNSENCSVSNFYIAGDFMEPAIRNQGSKGIKVYSGSVVSTGASDYGFTCHPHGATNTAALDTIISDIQFFGMRGAWIRGDDTLKTDNITLSNLTFQNYSDRFIEFEAESGAVQVHDTIGKVTLSGITATGSGRFIEMSTNRAVPDEFVLTNSTFKTTNDNSRIAYYNGTGHPSPKVELVNVHFSGPEDGTDSRNVRFASDDSSLVGIASNVTIYGGNDQIQDVVKNNVFVSA